MLIAREVAERGLVDIAYVEHAFAGEQLHVAQDVFLFLVNRQRARGLALIEVRGQPLAQAHRELLDCVAALALLARAVEPLLRGIQILEAEFGLNRANVGNRVDSVLHVHHVLVLEAAHHMSHRVDFANVRQELVAQAFTLGRAAHQAGNVHEANAGQDLLVGVVHLGERTDALVRHCHDADVRLDRAEREIRRFRLGVRQRVEQSAFADIRQTDDSTGKTHCALSLMSRPASCKPKPSMASAARDCSANLAHLGAAPTGYGSQSCNRTRPSLMLSSLLVADHRTERTSPPPRSRPGRSGPHWRKSSCHWHQSETKRPPLVGVVMPRPTPSYRTNVTM